MNGLDILLAILVGVPASVGLWRGILFPAFFVLGIALGITLGLLLSPELPARVAPLRDAGDSAVLALFLVVFFVVFCSSLVAARGLDRVLRRRGLKWMDRAGGALVGATAGLILSALVVVLCAAALPESSDLLVRSRLAPQILRIVENARYLLPEAMQDRYKERLDALDGAGGAL